ncbi:MAG TPA: hypothetical protein PKD10_07700 [Paracoccaceae bacterium]|nr:hypothetical protein [Paracoccaceae bacterium]
MRWSAIGLVLGTVMMTAPFWVPRLMPEAPAPAAQTAARPVPQAQSPVGDAFGGVVAALDRPRGLARLTGGGVALDGPAAPAAQTPAPLVPLAAPSRPTGVSNEALAEAMIAEACREMARGMVISEADCRSAALAGLAAQQAERPTAGRLPQMAPPKRSQRPPDAKFVKVAP